jgi:hypothetical protein
MAAIFRVLLALFIVSCATATAQTAQSTVERLAGVWEVVSPTGRSGCDAAQTFAVSADGRYVDLTERDAEGVYTARYIVLQAQPDRILMFIEGEARLTAQGDPVIWWAVFDGPDTFRWRRYDWPQTAMTDAQWRRCIT